MLRLPSLVNVTTIVKPSPKTRNGQDFFHSPELSGLKFLVWVALGVPFQGSQCARFAGRVAAGKVQGNPYGSGSQQSARACHWHGDALS